MENKIELPKLQYSYNELSPFFSEEQLKIHHTKHHQAYVNAANELMEKIEKARKENSDLDMKATAKALSFNIAGHVLHSLFWENLSPAAKADAKPVGALAKAIDSEFGGFDRLKKEFSQTALNIEGSGWSALAVDAKTKKLFLLQIEKHNVNIIPEYKLLLVLDMWEHAFYIDYKNDKTKFVEAFWNNINWKEANKRFE